MGGCINTEVSSPQKLFLSEISNKTVINRRICNATIEISLTDHEIQVLTNGLLNQIVTQAAGSSLLVPNQDIEVSQIDDDQQSEISQFSSIISQNSVDENSFYASELANHTRTKLLLHSLTQQYSQKKIQSSSLSQQLFFQILDEHPEIYDKIQNDDSSISSDDFKLH